MVIIMIIIMMLYLRTEGEGKRAKWNANIEQSIPSLLN